jgi:hypothetical protein
VPPSLASPTDDPFAASRIDHAVADDPMGVFTLADVALAKESHNASPLRAPNGSYILWHIGSGGGGSSFAHHAEVPAGPWYPLRGPRCNNPAPLMLRNGCVLWHAAVNVLSVNVLSVNVLPVNVVSFVVHACTCACSCACVHVWMQRSLQV